MRWLVFAAALAGCGTRSPAVAPNSSTVATTAGATSPPAKSPAPPTFTPAEVAAFCFDSVVIVQTPEGFGAGFVVEGGRVVTSLHVVKGHKTIKVRTSDGAEHPVFAVAAYDRDDDIAVLIVGGLSVEPLALGDSTRVAPGEPVTVIGHPRGLEATVSTGVVAALREEKDGFHLLQITAPISPGSSGGPVLNERAEVVGVVRALLPNAQALNFATPSAGLQALLRYELAPSTLEQFASATADSPTPVAEPVQTPAASPRTDSRARFPPSIAGFSFGMSWNQVAFLCAEAPQQRAAKSGLPWSSLLEKQEGHLLSCPFSPQPLDFLDDRVSLEFRANRLTFISLRAKSWHSTLVRVAKKYGPPRRLPERDELTTIPKAPIDVAWWPEGGGIMLSTNGWLSFQSELSRELELEGF